MTRLWQPRPPTFADFGRVWRAARAVHVDPLWALIRAGIIDGHALGPPYDGPPPELPLADPDPGQVAGAIRPPDPTRAGAA